MNIHFRRIPASHLSGALVLSRTLRCTRHLKPRLLPSTMPSVKPGDSALSFSTGTEERGGLVLWEQYSGATGESRRRVCMVSISEPYIIRYPQIVAVADDTGGKVELVEFFDCIGGAMWTQHHYAKSPLVESVRCVGATTRFL